MYRIAIVGGGFVGLPNAMKIAEVLGPVFLFDKNETRLKQIKNGLFFSQTEENKLDTLVQNQISQNKLVLSNNPSDLVDCNIFIICVNYDLGEGDNEFNNLKSIFTEFISLRTTELQTNFIIQPTLPVGTIDRLISELRTEFENYIDFNFDEQFLFTYCFERIMPGKYYLESINLYDRVFHSSTEQAKEVYLKLEENLGNVLTNYVEFPNFKAVEFCKLTENTYRAATIYLSHEFNILAKNYNIDVNQVIAEIKKRPTHSNIAWSGSSPGGYCLPKDFQLLLQNFTSDDARIPWLSGLNQNFQNQDQFLFDWIDETLEKSECTNCLIVGLNYKNDVEDDRNSTGFKYLERFSPINRSIINHRKTGPFKNCDVYKNLEEFLTKNNPKHTALVIFNINDASNLLSKNFKTIIDCNNSLSEDDIESISSRSASEYVKFGKWDLN